MLRTLIATLGGFQFGYAIGVMAGAILFIASQLGLTPEQQGWAVSAFLVGTLPGAIVAGPLANRWGRKRMQQIVALLFFIGTLVLIVATSLPHIFAGRVVQGLAAGAISVVGPLYIAEVSPAAKRGTYVGFYQMAVTLGILVAYGVNLLWASSGAWHTMFGVALIPAVLHGVGFFYLPDSRPQHKEPTKISWKAFLEPKIRKGLSLILLINVFQQITGINAILYFAPSIFQASGFASPSSALLPPIFVGAINFGLTILATYYLDRLGRRPLLLVGIAGMVVSLIGLSLGFVWGEGAMKWLATASILFYTASFAIGLGPIPQLLGAELLPYRVRGQGAGMGMISNWIFNFLVVFSFMDLTSHLSHAGVFALYAVFGVLAFVFVRKYLPETKGAVLSSD